MAIGTTTMAIIPAMLFPTKLFPTMLSQLFSDVDGFLLSTSFLSTLSTLVSTFLLAILSAITGFGAAF